MVVSTKQDYELHTKVVNHKNKYASIVSSPLPPRTPPQAYPFSMNYENRRGVTH